MPEEDLLAGRVAEFIRDLPRNVVGALATNLDELAAEAQLSEVEAVLSSGVPATARPYCSALMQTIRQQEQSLDPSGLARILRVAGEVDHRGREEQTIEVVWSGPVPPRSTLRRSEQALLETIEASTYEIWMVSFVAYKIPDVREALMASIDRGVQVSLLLENEESSGGSIDFDGIHALQGIRSKGARVFEWPLENRSLGENGKPGLLHAKACVVDRRRMLVSSANLTEKAFDANMELGLLLRGGVHPGRIARHLSWMVEQGVIREIG